ncbi:MULTISPECIES: hypothetical protein [unclassified Streptomyces]|uniref:hypothetical protein n=1 Tax=unclassified Streptomyces TaxID=2593676 RepID=UPI0034503C8D
MSVSTPPSSLTADYARRIADDLSANRSEQERVCDELTRLRAELSQLEECEHVLLKMQQVLGAGEASAAPTAEDVVSVPQARRPSNRTNTRTAKSSRGAKSAATPGSSPAAGPSTPARNTGGPTWRELITEHFTGVDGPRSATEITAALAEAHPHRKVRVAVVRNALEQGVAQARLERSKQGRSVFYSPVPAASLPPEETDAAAP